jgi:hypothetical protein
MPASAKSAGVIFLFWRRVTYCVGIARNRPRLAADGHAISKSADDLRRFGIDKPAALMLMPPLG